MYHIDIENDSNKDVNINFSFVEASLKEQFQKHTEDFNRIKYVKT